MAVSPGIEDRVTPADDDHGAGVDALTDPGSDHGIHDVEALGDGRGRAQRQECQDQQG